MHQLNESDSVFWTSEKQLILASHSTARSNLLRAAGLDHLIHPAAINERAVESGLTMKSANAIAGALAEAKAAAIARTLPCSIVIGADQVLECEGKIFHKPADIAQARIQLLSLRGKEHQLHSGVAVAQGQAVEYRQVVTAYLTVRPFSEAFLDEYLERAGPAVLGAVGCYHIEAIGAQIFEKVQGDQFTVMGLPLLPLLSYFRKAGYLRT